MNKKCWKFAHFVDVNDYGNRVYQKGNKGIDVNMEAETDGGVKYADEERTLYPEGYWLQRIARILTPIYGKLFHNQTLMNWISKAGLETLKKSQK